MNMNNMNCNRLFPTLFYLSLHINTQSKASHPSSRSDPGQIQARSMLDPGQTQVRSVTDSGQIQAPLFSHLLHQQ